MATKTVTAKGPQKWTPAHVAHLCTIPDKDGHRNPEYPGFYLRVSPKLKAVYGYRFRDDKGKLAGKKIADAAEGGAPRGWNLEKALEFFKKKQLFLKKEKAPGVLDLCAGFLDWHGNSEIAGGGGKKSPRTLDWYQELYSRCLEAKAGQLVLEETDGKRWGEILKPIKLASPSQAKGCYWMLHAIYHRCIDLHMLERNPLANDTLRGEFSGKSAKRKRHAQVEAMDLKTFVDGIAAIPRRGHGKRALYVLLLTGWRKSAVLQMRWDQIDAKNRAYIVKEHDEGWKGYVGPIALNALALEHIEERRAEGGEDESEWVFPAYGLDTKKPYLRNLYGSIASASHGLGTLIRPHDLRRTFATIGAVVLGGNLALLGRLLGHKQPEESGSKEEKAKSGTETTRGYIIANVRAEAESSRQVAQAIMEIAGALPLSQEVEVMFKKRGVDLGRVHLVEMADDDGEMADDSAGAESEEIDDDSDVLEDVLEAAFNQDIAKTTPKGAPAGTVEDVARRLAAVPAGAGFGRFRDTQTVTVPVAPQRTPTGTQADTKEPVFKTRATRAPRSKLKAN